MNQGRVKNVFVTNESAANTGTDLSTITEGDVLILNSLNQNLTGSPTVNSAEGNEAIKIALGLPAGLPDSEKGFRLSSTIIGKNITSWKKEPYAAAVEQDSAIGYNGITGDLSLQAGTEYRLRLSLRDRHRMRPHRKSEWDYYYKTGDTVDKVDAALSFARKINNDTRVTRRQFVATVVFSPSSIVELTTDATLTNGSKVVVSVGHGLSVGTLLSIRNILYRVSAVPTANSFELDRNYTGVSETIDVSLTVELIATVTSVDLVGVTIQAQPVKTRSVDLYQQIKFDVNLAPVNGEIGSEQQVTTAPASQGSGTYDLVKDMEFFDAAERGITNRRLFPIDDYSPIAQPSGNYVLYTIDYYEEVNNDVAGVTRNQMTTILAFDISTAATKANAIEGILDSYIGSTGLAAV